MANLELGRIVSITNLIFEGRVFRHKKNGDNQQLVDEEWKNTDKNLGEYDILLCEQTCPSEGVIKKNIIYFTCKNFNALNRHTNACEQFGKCPLNAERVTLIGEEETDIYVKVGTTPKT